MSPRIPTSWIGLLWITSVSTFQGWHLVDYFFGRQNAKVYFYVAQGALGALMALSIVYLLERPVTEMQRIFLFALAVYVASEQVLVSVCGGSFYWFSDLPSVGYSVCDKDHSWSWGILGLCLLILIRYFWGRRN